MQAFALKSWLIGIARLARRWQCPYESTFSINYLDFQYKHPRSPARGAKALDARAKFVHCLEASMRAGLSRQRCQPQAMLAAPGRRERGKRICSGIKRANALIT